QPGGRRVPDHQDVGHEDQQRHDPPRLVEAGEERDERRGQQDRALGAQDRQRHSGHCRGSVRGHAPEVSVAKATITRSVTDVHGSRAAKGIAAQVAGWILVVAGLAALVLPGPGLLALFAGMTILATQYDWAERRHEPVKKASLRTAAESVQSVPRILMSVLLPLGLEAVGVGW